MERGINQSFHSKWKGGVEMKPSSFETAIQLQFDTLMKKVIDRLVKDYEKELKRHSKNETLFSELPEIEVLY